MKFSYIICSILNKDKILYYFKYKIMISDITMVQLQKTQIETLFQNIYLNIK